MRKLTKEEFEKKVLEDLRLAILMWVEDQDLDSRDVIGIRDELIYDGWTPPSYDE